MCVDLSLGFLFCSIDLYFCLEESTYLTSGSTTKPQLSRQYGTGTKTEIKSLLMRVKEENEKASLKINI